MTNSREEIDKVLEDPFASYWLKKALRTALCRDTWQAAKDGEKLFELLRARWFESTKR